MIFKYDTLNREERALCSHLFRLLHERLDGRWNSPLGKFILKLVANCPNDPVLKGLVGSEKWSPIGIFTEVALIRDTYEILKSHPEEFLDSMLEIIGNQNNLIGFRKYSQLDAPFNLPSETHPSQIRKKARDKSYQLTLDEWTVYGSLQGMFNAKPDIAIVLNGSLLVFEAKFTLGFDEVQMQRTRDITQVWSSLLYESLGFEDPPQTTVIKLGAKRFDPDISWQEVFEIVRETYPPHDRTYIAMKCALNFIN